MTDDRRKREIERARFARRSIDFGDLPTVPMDLYPQDNAIAVPEIVRESTIDPEQWAEIVEAVEDRKP